MTTISQIEALLIRNKPAPSVDTVRCAAVAVILLQHADDVHVLLLKRAIHERDPWSGHVSLPGGRYESSDQHLHATAIRETMEETGIDLTTATWLGQAPPLHPLSGGPRGMEVTPFIFSIATAPDIALSREATHHFWLPLRSALRGTFASELTLSHGTFPCWNYQGYVVWGLTLRILSLLA